LQIDKKQLCCSFNEFIEIQAGYLNREIIVDFQNMETAYKKIDIKPFSINKYPVTNEQFSCFLHETGYSPCNENSSFCKFFVHHWGKKKLPAQQILRHPVTFVSYDDAVAYAQFVDGRLPTYFEWLIAAFGNTNAPFPWGEEFSPEKCNVRESKLDGTSPIGMFSPPGDSPSGCSDMIGNVWEWTATSVFEEDFLAMGTGWDHYSWQTEIPLNREYRNHSVGFRIVRNLV